MACTSAGRSGASWSSAGRSSCTRRDTEMIAGLPGTGIGGLFYVITALGTPFRAWRARREGRADGSELGAWALVLMAAGLMGAVWLTGWAVGVLLGHPLTRALAAIRVARTVAPPPSLIRTVSLLLAVATLVTVLAAVEVARRSEEHTSELQSLAY